MVGEGESSAVCAIGEVRFPDIHQDHNNNQSIQAVYHNVITSSPIRVLPITPPPNQSPPTLS